MGPARLMITTGPVPTATLELHSGRGTLGGTKTVGRILDRVCRSCSRPCEPGHQGAVHTT
ncbi:hypothetical protein ACFXPI_17915 [Streptomyces sp. NPDC059104]|uniref:hypothetical protein n=1 Tax=Streptomyces sp. NPDC059104 TaxID=3346729 RepID=UPI0036CA4ADD